MPFFFARRNKRPFNNMSKCNVQFSMIWCSMTHEGMTHDGGAVERKPSNIFCSFNKHDNPNALKTLTFGLKPSRSMPLSKKRTARCSLIKKQSFLDIQQNNFAGPGPLIFRSRKLQMGHRKMFQKKSVFRQFFVRNFNGSGSNQEESY